MVKLAKKIIKQVISFVCNQYLVLFFILSIGLKLAYFNTSVIKVTWPIDQYNYGIFVGFLSVAVIFLPIYFTHKHKNKLAVLLNALISVVLLIDTIYYSYFAALPTVGLLNSIGLAGSVGPAILDLLHWQLILYFADIFLVIVLQKPFNTLLKKIKSKFNFETQNYKISLAMAIVTMTVFLTALSPIGPTKFNDVVNKGYDTVLTSQYYGLIMAHAVDTIRFISQEITHLSAAQEAAISDWVSANKPSQITSDLNGIAEGKNVIMIQIESLGGFVINKTVNDKEITPNLNDLAQTSQFFPNYRFIIGAGHTSDTDFVANTSYFPLDESAIFVRHGQDDFTGLPKLLVANGYSAYAYHGFNRNFWNRDIALASLGYQKFYAADNYPKGSMINLGLNDGDFLAKTAEYIKDQPKPSFSYVVTLTSHAPFLTNDQMKNLGINRDDYPDQVGGYLENINYVDRMLGDFFTKLRAEGLYDDSLIIVYGDHTPVLSAFVAGDIKYDPTTVQGKEVPLFIKLPQATVGKIYPNQGTVLDTMPTVLDLLGTKTDQLMFGQSLFASKSAGALKVCLNQLVAFYGVDDCKTTLDKEKSISSQIIRYNQFDKL